MKIEIDQSGKIEETNKRTVIGDSEGNFVTILAKDKREIQEIYRLSNLPRKFKIHLFSLIVTFLISKTFDNGKVYYIDLEYPGYENEILFHISSFSKKMNQSVDADQIRFKGVGKSSKSHETSHKAFKLKHPQNIVRLPLLLQHLLPQKRTE